MICLSEIGVKLYLVKYFWQILCFRLAEMPEKLRLVGSRTFSFNWTGSPNNVHKVCYKLNIFHMSYVINDVD